MSYRKLQIYRGVKLSLDIVTTPTSVVKPKFCILNRTTGLPVDIYFQLHDENENIVNIDYKKVFEKLCVYVADSKKIIDQSLCANL